MIKILDENFYKVDHLSWQNIFVTRMQTPDLFAVANVLGFKRLGLADCSLASDVLVAGRSRTSLILSIFIDQVQLPRESTSSARDTRDVSSRDGGLR